MENSKTPSKVRAQDMRHILLVLPFLLHDLVRPEVEEYNTQHPGSKPLVDPSSELIDVTLLLLTWYRLFRSSDPAKDKEDIQESKEPGCGGRYCFCHNESGLAQTGLFAL